MWHKRTFGLFLFSCFVWAVFYQFHRSPTPPSPQRSTFPGDPLYFTENEYKAVETARNAISEDVETAYRQFFIEWYLWNSIKKGSPYQPPSAVEEARIKEKEARRRMKEFLEENPEAIFLLVKEMMRVPGWEHILLKEVMTDDFTRCGLENDMLSNQICAKAWLATKFN